VRALLLLDGQTSLYVIKEPRTLRLLSFPLIEHLVRIYSNFFCKAAEVPETPLLLLNVPPQRKCGKTNGNSVKGSAARGRCALLAVGFQGADVDLGISGSPEENLFSNDAVPDSH